MRESWQSYTVQSKTKTLKTGIAPNQLAVRSRLTVNVVFAFFFLSINIYRQLQWETEILRIYQLQKSPETMKSGSSVKHLNEAGWIQPYMMQT